MKKKVIALAAMAVVVLTASTIIQSPMTKQGKTTIINTTELGKNVRGFKSTTPLKVYITNGKITKVEALPNKETPKYFEMVKKGMINKWNGMTVKKAQTAEVDGVSGATFSSRAVKKNVQLAAEYYQKNK